MYEEEFAERLTKLRMERDVSARDMSLSIGKNPGYICEIESNHALPSMGSFFFMCEYLQITPRDFFDIETDSPGQLRELNKYLRMLNPMQLEHVTHIVKDMLQISTRIGN